MSLLCYRAGKPRGLKTVDPTRRRNRLSHCCGCPVVISIITSGTVPRIGKIVWMHVGHDVHDDFHVPSHRILPPIVEQDIARVADSMMPSDVLNYIRGQHPDTSITFNQVRYGIQKYKHVQRGGVGTSEDANAFCTLLASDPNIFYVRMCRSENGDAFTGAFWVTKAQAVLWGQYWRVIIQDVTHNTTKHKLPVSLFTVVDRDWRSRVVAQAIVYGETANWHDWILSRLGDVLALTVMEQVDVDLTLAHPTALAPQPESQSQVWDLSFVFATDFDQAVIKSLKSRFPNSRHIVCAWHLHQALVKHAGAKFGSKDRSETFMAEFFRCRDISSPSEFEGRWVELLEVYEEMAEYLKRTWGRIRQSWAFCYVKSMFSAGVISTSRVEGMNARLKQNQRTMQTLVELKAQVEHVVSKQSERALEETQVRSIACVPMHFRGVPLTARRYDFLHRLPPSHHINSVNSDRLKPCLVPSFASFAGMRQRTLPVGLCRKWKRRRLITACDFPRRMQLPVGSRDTSAWISIQRPR